MIPIRQLLKRLPEVCQPGSDYVAGDLQQCWATAQWDGLAVGLPAATQSLITAALARVPGTPDAQIRQEPDPANRHFLAHQNPAIPANRPCSYFCPSPVGNLGAEAAWRLLAHIAQTPFYQRLRGELQLGYAVFSGLRQINGQTGLLFGVQSPHASTAEIFGHIRTFLADLPQLVSSLDEALHPGS